MNHEEPWLGGGLVLSKKRRASPGGLHRRLPDRGRRRQTARSAG
jgi:hypothetical protein